MPNTVENIMVMDGGGPIIANNSENLTNIYCGSVYPNTSFVIKEFFDSLKNAPNLSDLTLTRLSMINFTSLSGYLDDDLPSVINLDLSGLYGSTSLFQNVIEDLNGIEKFTNLESLTVANTDSILDISAIKNCPTITKVVLSHGNIQSLSGIEGLTNLQALSVNDNSIAGVKELENLTNLTYLNLQDNLISDTSTYVNEAGETITYNNLEILANLNSNRNGKLTDLYLSGNDNIINWTPVSSLTWASKSGF